jgi:hypothetical protein
MSGGDNKQITQGNIQKPGDPELVADIRREIAHGVRLLELCPTPPGEGRTRQETLINLRPQIHEEWRRDPTESSKSVPKRQTGILSRQRRILQRQEEKGEKIHLEK